MRFKRYILLSLVLCGLAACSDDNTIEIPEAPVLEKAQLALAIKSEKGTTTKAGEAVVPTDADVNKLTVGVFGTGWNVVYTVSGSDITKTTTDNVATQEIGPKEVYAGTADVIVVANASTEVQTALSNADTKDAFLSTVIKLEEENLTKGLTMSSEVLTVSLVANTTNFIGYASETGDITVGDKTGKEIYGDGPVRLVRDVASIALASVRTENPDKANYESKSFTLKEVFIASAKGVSSVASSGYWGSIEKVFSFTERGFGYSDYKVGQNFSKTPANIDEGSYKRGTQTVLASLFVKDTEGYACNHEFYVYENKEGEIEEKSETGANRDYANHTLLIVKGDYTYLPKGLADTDANYVTKKDCYYAVPVGAEVTINNKTELNFYVQRNYKYAIDLTIIGPGSEIPYDPMVSANVSTSVKVTPWTVKEIHENVE